MTFSTFGLSFHLYALTHQLPPPPPPLPLPLPPPPPPCERTSHADRHTTRQLATLPLPHRTNHPNRPIAKRIRYASQAGSGNKCYASGWVGEVASTIGYVTAVADNGFYIQQNLKSRTWEGIFVYDDDYLDDVARGDLVVLTGVVAEYYGSTQLASVSEFRVVSSGHVVIPVTVSTGSLGLTCSFLGEGYEVSQQRR